MDLKEGGRLRGYFCDRHQGINRRLDHRRVRAFQQLKISLTIWGLKKKVIQCHVSGRGDPPALKAKESNNPESGKGDNLFPGCVVENLAYDGISGSTKKMQKESGGTRVRRIKRLKVKDAL